MPPRASETTAERPAWDRITGESRKAYEAFRRYRDTGPHRSLHGCRSIERRWSWRWRWAERAGEWDSELWRRADEATLLAAGRPGSSLDVGHPVELGGAFASIVDRLVDTP